MHSTVKDSGAFFVVDPVTRTVTALDGQRAIGVAGDHLSEQVTFEAPQFIDGHDVTMCGRKYVTWVNVLSEVGHDELVLDRTEGGKAYFVWTVRNGLTQAQGFVQFALHFEDVDADQATVYRWSTSACKDCEVLGSVNAVLSTYEAIYVAGDTLVIDDYNPVEGNTLSLNMGSINAGSFIPEGTLEITEVGPHDVFKYAAVDVNIALPEGTKQITTNGTHDVERFKEVEVAVPAGYVGTIVNHSSGNFYVTYYYPDKTSLLDGRGMVASQPVASGGSYTFEKGVIPTACIQIHLNPIETIGSAVGILTCREMLRCEDATDTAQYNRFLIRATNSGFTAEIVDA